MRQWIPGFRHSIFNRIASLSTKKDLSASWKKAEEKYFELCTPHLLEAVNVGALSERPLLLKLDENQRLHCADGPAIKYAVSFYVIDRQPTVEMIDNEWNNCGASCSIVSEIPVCHRCQSFPRRRMRHVVPERNADEEPILMVPQKET